MIISKCYKKCILKNLSPKTQMCSTYAQQILESLYLKNDELQEKLIVADTEAWQQETGENEFHASRYTCNYTLRDTEAHRETRSVVPFDLKSQKSNLQFIAGLDVSYLRNRRIGCVALVVCQLPNLEVVYEDLQMTEMNVLFRDDNGTVREVPAYLEAIERLRTLCPQLKPQVLLIDGHGISTRGTMGPASLVGILTDIPTIGITKRVWKSDMSKVVQLLVVDHYTVHFLSEPMKSINWATAVLYGTNPTKSLSITVGHRFTIFSAIEVVKQCLKFRIPEPIRQADLRSRSFLQMKFPDLT